jgi:hypothetical protein
MQQVKQDLSMKIYAGFLADPQGGGYKNLIGSDGLRSVSTIVRALRSQRRSCVIVACPRDFD